MIYSWGIAPLEIYRGWKAFHMSCSKNEPRKKSIGPRGCTRWIEIEGWEYLLSPTSDGAINIHHAVTPADGGYGQTVDLDFPAEYFKTHSVDAFYDDVAAENISPAPEYIHRAWEIEAICRTFQETEWLPGFGVE